jgi:hypothetical protein
MVYDVFGVFVGVPWLSVGCPGVCGVWRAVGGVLFHVLVWVIILVGGVGVRLLTCCGVGRDLGMYQCCV